MVTFHIVWNLYWVLSECFSSLYSAYKYKNIDSLKVLYNKVFVVGQVSTIFIGI